MTDSVQVRGAEDSLDEALTFHVERTPGFYHIQVTYIAFFVHDGKWIAQLERFFQINSLSRLIGVRKRKAN